MSFIVSGSDGGTFPSWTTATRPASPAVGQMGYNTTTGLFDQYVSGAWQSVPASSGAVPSFTTYGSSSGTYTTPAGAKYLQVIMLSGGGGGGGSATGAGTGGTGGTTTFGTSLLTCSGAGGGAPNTYGGGGGSATPTINSPATGWGVIGASGQAAQFVLSGSYVNGGMGGSSALGGSGVGGPANQAGGPGITNTGGGGAGGGSASSTFAGAGGGAGAYLNAIISAPSATYSYAVGAGGTAGTAGSSGWAGGAGGSGLIIVYAYF